MRPVIFLFAKAPLAGSVKTRLVGPVGDAAEVAELYQCFVRDMLELLAGFATEADLELRTDAQTPCWSDVPVPRGLQSAGDLGRRMLDALASALDSGRPQAIIVGSDAPTLPPSHLRRLLDSPADVALGPCQDGGYYAIACRRVHPRMFAGVEWSAASALEQTVAAATRCGLRVELGEPWFDVDTPGDLERLARSALPRHTGGWFGRRTPKPSREQ